MSIKFKLSMQLSGIILAILLASNVYAWSEGRHCVGGEGKEGMKEKMEERFKEVSKELNLTPEQEEQLKNHKTQCRETMKEFRKKIADKREELGKELQKQEIDMEKINQLNSELKAVHSEMQDNRLKGILEVREVLSPEQFAKFREFTEKCRPRMKSHRKGRGAKPKVKE